MSWAGNEFATWIKSVSNQAKSGQVAAKGLSANGGLVSRAVRRYKDRVFRFGVDSGRINGAIKPGSKCQILSARTPGFMIPAGSSARLAAASAAPKRAGRWARYQGMWSRPTA